MCRDHVPARICRHVAVGQRIVEDHACGGKLAAQLASEAAFLGFDDSAGVMRDQTAQDRVGEMCVAQVPGAVERMKAGLDQLGRVADVVQPRSGFEQIGVITENRGKRSGSRRDPLNMRPAAGEWGFEVLASEFLGPDGLIHAITVVVDVRDVHGRGVPSSDVPARLV
jgi:hypothetical protein